MKSRLVLLCVLAALGLFWFHAPLAAQTDGWTPPVEVSPPLPDPNQPADAQKRRYGSSWFADLALGPQGSVHVIWYSGIALGGEVASSLDLLMYRELRDGVWSGVNEVAAPATGGLTVRNNIVLGRDGRLHAIYRAGTRIVYSSAPWDEAWSARVWSEPQFLSGGASYYTALATDSTGALHAFWSEAIPDDPNEPNLVCANCADLFYRRSNDGGNFWTPAVNLSQTIDGENRPQVKIDAQNRIHVTWDEGVDWYAGQGVPKTGVYRRSDDGGQTWTAPVAFRLPTSAVQVLERAEAARRAELPTPTPLPEDVTPPSEPVRNFDTVQQTALALDAAGNPFVVFRGVKNDRLYFARSTDGGDTWSEPQEIPGVLARDINDNNLDIYTMATDGAGAIHLAMIGFLASSFDPNRRTNPTLIHLIWDGTRWSAPEPVVTNDLYPEYPRLVSFGGTQLHMVWFTRSIQDLFNSEQARYRVWYSRRDLNAPAATPLPLFTPVPTAQPTEPPPPPLPTPTPTPLPPEVLNAPPLINRPAWEGPGMLILGIAFAPIVVMFFLILGLRRLIVRLRHRNYE